MVNKLVSGDYVAQGGGITRMSGSDAAFANAVFRLQCRRGSFPFLPELGSRLWQLGRLRPGDWEVCARQYCIEALQGSGVEVQSVQVTQQGQAICVETELTLGENTLLVEVNV
ncbi:MAG: hypothetical protein E7464_03795 [Ruminococcaceae bacterium]|nr:hypothetical protein [Oscillospiraceae bacterium]